MEGQVVRGAAAAEVRAILGDPWRVEAEGGEESWVYRERWADGIDRWGQIVLGFLTLGIYGSSLPKRGTTRSSSATAAPRR